MTEPEPTGWELMRALQDLRKSVDNLAIGMVTQGTLTIYQQAQKQTDDRQDARIKQLEIERDEARKTKAQQWFAIGTAILAGVISLGVGLFLNFSRGGVG